MEEVFSWKDFWSQVQLDPEAAVATLSIDIVTSRPREQMDLLSYCCHWCKSDNIAYLVAQKLLQLGYVYYDGCTSDYSKIAVDERWKLFHYLMRVSGAYRDPLRLKYCLRYLDQRNIDPFLDRGIILETSDTEEYQKFLTFQTAREKARIASIALIGVGKWRKRVDAFRVISRVVWSERCDEKWLE